MCNHLSAHPKRWRPRNYRSDLEFLMFFGEGMGGEVVQNARHFFKEKMKNLYHGDMLDADQLEQKMVPPRGDSRVEVVFWNAVRVVLHGKTAQGPNRKLVEEAHVLLESIEWPRYAAEMGSAFRQRMQDVVAALCDEFHDAVQGDTSDIASQFVTKLRRALSGA